MLHLHLGRRHLDLLARLLELLLLGQLEGVLLLH
jgi:hypothetical protein